MLSGKDVSAEAVLDDFAESTEESWKEAVEAIKERLVKTNVFVDSDGIRSEGQRHKRKKRERKTPRIGIAIMVMYDICNPVIQSSHEQLEQ